MRPYVTEVESNIQGGVKAKLGPKTLIIGPNRIGKSSIVRAIELATTGRASDVAGRDTLALDAELFSLAPDDAEIASATVKFSDGKTAGWTLMHGKKSKRAGSVALFPLRDVRSAILGSAETARKFFLSVVGGIGWHHDVLPEIAPQFHARLKPYEPPKGGDGAAGLLAAIEGLKKRVRDLNADARAQRTTATATSQGLPPPPSPAEVAQAKAAGETAARASQVARARDRLALVEVEGRAVSDRLEEAAKRAEDAKKKLAALPPEASLPEVVTHAIAVGEFHTTHGATECAICGSTVNRMIFAARTAKAKAKIAAALAAQKRRTEVEAEIREMKFDLGALCNEGDRLSAERDSLKAIIGDAPDASAPAGDYPTLIAVATKWETIRAAEGRAVELEAEATIVGQLVTLCSTALERLLEKSRKGFEARVQKYLPKSMCFGVDLKDGDRDVFRIGLRTTVEVGKVGDDRIFEHPLRTALSGAEWATVTAAIASAVAESADPSSPVIIVPEDRDFDSNTLADVMESFSSIDAQVILTGTKPPSRDVSGWTVIDLGAANETPYCQRCKSWIIAGPCDHGVGPQAKRAVGDLFGA